MPVTTEDDVQILFCKWEEVSLRALLNRGARVHLVLDAFDLDHARPDPELLGKMAAVWRVSHDDSIDELSAVAADLLVSGVHIDRIASFTEFSQFGAGLLAELLGLDDTSPRLALNARDKRMMKIKAKAAGWRHARFIDVSRHDQRPDPATLAETVGFPMVAKPVNGMGSLSTTLVRDAGRLEALLKQPSFAPELHSHQLVLEEHISGSEYHVDAVWRRGKPWQLHISRYLRPRIEAVDPGHDNGSLIVPRDDDPELYAYVEERHVALNAELGFDTGVTHLELFRTGAGEIYFSEIATRLAGANVPEAIGAYCGVNLREAWVHELCGGSPESLEYTDPPFRYVGWINLAPACDGVISDMPSKEDLAADPNILEWTFLHKVGDRVELAHPSVWCLLLVIGADTIEDFHAAVARIEREHPLSVAGIDTNGGS
ncbi:ATP-grasp domain-containing protein [Nonomuraea diastatica]|uniref:ATP-grasp domain-containing protein n=1 Tax=Nonomuraea diastatica TaxID=1848329 RepID=A0A4R4WMH1_9ACTN|nr:ATP-grasp domain-containing protein [Nonomuraea diastatica]TDD20282.1 ATP-grasp domain-containing protein [Nonomuraea diastatica]